MKVIRQDEKLRLAIKLGQVTAPNHPYQPTDRGCAACASQSPFKYDEGSHPYVIEEDPF